MLGALFFVSGIGKIFGFAGVAGWMASAGVPFAPSCCWSRPSPSKSIGGLLLVIGWQVAPGRAGAGRVPGAGDAVFHGFWSADAAHFQDQLTAFLKNLAILGGMLLVFERSTVKQQ